MLKQILQGMVVGIANIIPGVSGGTMMVPKCTTASFRLMLSGQYTLSMLISVFPERKSR